MKLDFPDVNVWVALADSGHPFHHRASKYWVYEAQEVIAFNRHTMMGFMRLTMTPSARYETALSISEAWRAYRAFRNSENVNFLHDPQNFEGELEMLTVGSSFKLRTWTDACLAAWAIGHDARLVSFDADFEQFPGLNFLHLTTD